MNRHHTLLAATDLSAPSRHAALRAAMLAHEADYQLDLLHILESSPLSELQKLFGHEGEILREHIRSQARIALSQLATDIGEPLGISVGEHLVEGAVLESCISHADLIDARLLVVGVRGTGFMRHWLLGATAERLLRKTLRPILIVKQPAHEPYRSLLVAVDFSTWSLAAIHLARTLAPKAEIILMHAYEAPYEGKLRYAGVEDHVIQSYRETARQQAFTRLQQIAADAGLTEGDWHPAVTHGDAASRILEQEEIQGADLIVLGKHGAGMVEELLLGSVTKHVLAHSRSDVLVATN